MELASVCLGLVYVVHLRMRGTEVSGTMCVPSHRARANPSVLPCESSRAMVDAHPRASMHVLWQLGDVAVQRGAHSTSPAAVAGETMYASTRKRASGARWQVDPAPCCIARGQTAFARASCPVFPPVPHSGATAELRRLMKTTDSMLINPTDETVG